MRSSTARGTLLIGLALVLAGCSTTGGTSSKTSWWPSALSLKSRKSTASSVASSNAPSAPVFGSTTSLAPSVSMPGGAYDANAATGYGGPQYPVTPYPATTAGGYPAGAAPTAASAYMPPNNPYAQSPPASPYDTTAASGYPAANDSYAQTPAANPYATTAAANPYAAAASANPQVQANPYAAAAASQQSAYTASGQYGSSPYPGAPSSSGDSPYSYR